MQVVLNTGKKKVEAPRIVTLTERKAAWSKIIDVVIADGNAKRIYNAETKQGCWMAYQLLFATYGKGTSWIATLTKKDANKCKFMLATDATWSKIVDFANS